MADFIIYSNMTKLTKKELAKIEKVMKITTWTILTIIIYIVVSSINNSVMRWSVINKWDGKLPSTMTGEVANVLLDLKK